MGKMIYAGSSSKKKANKKPGWREAAKQEAEWLAKLNSMSLGSKSYGGKAKKPVAKSLSVPTDSPTIVRTEKNKQFAISSLGGYVPEVPTKVSVEVLYKENPEMLERELEARQRKFPTAPAYNKSGDVYMTPEMMKDVTAGLTRRR